ncbi:MAG: Uncharacterised protein [Formosa sp. Hel3_A1_48]|nr:MAG: Uncharacterised protein [Formosa sp. Hel3_A1_48]
MREILGSKILIIGAHPDDEVLGCGGLMAANFEANGITDILIVSEGTSAQFNSDKKASLRRKKQLKDSASMLGVAEIFHWDYPDMRLDEISHVELNSRIHNLIEEGEYKYIFTHHPHDVNLDHQVVFRSTLVATRPTPTSKVRGVFTYFVSSSTEWAMGNVSERFVPTCFLDISYLIEKKLDAFSIYEEEIRQYPHPRSIKAIKNRAHVYGSDVGVLAAEAFSLIYWR